MDLLSSYFVRIGAVVLVRLRGMLVMLVVVGCLVGVIMVIMYDVRVGMFICDSALWVRR